jgi:ribonuclease HII
MARTRSDSPLLFEMVDKPDFSIETKAMADGLWPVAGMDEAGRGPLAGPVVAAAVVLNPAGGRRFQTSHPFATRGAVP